MMSAPFDDSEHTCIAQTTTDYSSIEPWNDDFSNDILFFVKSLKVYIGMP